LGALYRTNVFVSLAIALAIITPFALFSSDQPNRCSDIALLAVTLNSLNTHTTSVPTTAATTKALLFGAGSNYFGKLSNRLVCSQIFVTAWWAGCGRQGS